MVRLNQVRGPNGRFCGPYINEQTYKLLSQTGKYMVRHRDNLKPVCPARDLVKNQSVQTSTKSSHTVKQNTEIISDLENAVNNEKNAIFQKYMIKNAKINAKSYNNFT